MGGPMRRIVTFNRVTAEGYFTSADGNLDWTVPEEEIDKGGGDAAPEFDTMLFGRRTYDMFEQFWPHVLAEDSATAPDPHTAGRRSPAIRTQAVFINDTPKLVFSRTRKDVTWKNSRLLGEFDPRAVEALKNQPGKDIIIFGSGSIVSLLTEHGLIDEYQFIVSPVLLGTGRPLIGGVSTRTKLELVECKEYASGNVKLRYARR
jgi:dihydrofolate reductase